MIILHLTTLWNGGGAADYTRNIHNNMLVDGYRSYVAVAGEIVVTPEGREISIEQTEIPLWEKIKREIHKKFIERRPPTIDYKYAGHSIKERFCEYNVNDLLTVMPENPDVILVHWISNFANAKYVRDLQQRTGAKVFYIMLDEAILSGGCHFPWNCEGYQHGCKNCKMTNSRVLKAFIRWNYLYKKHYLVDEKNVIAPTEFDVIRLKKSPLWKGCSIYKLIEVIDNELFSPAKNKSEVKSFFKIPDEKKVVFFGCSLLNEVRKGMSILIDALKKIERNDIVYLVAGANTLPALPNNIIHIGKVDIPTLAKAYQAADIFVCPSLEDSGPQMINMAIMSGVPTVAFEMGVALDIVITGKTGYRAKLHDSGDLANGIQYLLDLPTAQFDKMRETCRTLAMNTFSKRCQHDFFNKLFQS